MTILYDGHAVGLGKDVFGYQYIILLSIIGEILRILTQYLRCLGRIHASWDRVAGVTALFGASGGASAS